MSRYITDTHPLLWHLLADPRLSGPARAVFNDADAGVHEILIPSIVLVEAVYLADKKRIDSAAVDQLFSLLDLTPSNYPVVALDARTVCTLRTIDRAQVPDMPDRIIVATARQLGLELITKDATIASAAIVPVVG